MIPTLLPKITRRLSQIKGFWRITNQVQRLFRQEKINGGPRLVTINDYDGDLILRLDPNSYMGRCIYWHGYYSREELMVLDRVLEPEMTFVDIGANNGYFTLFAAKRLLRGQVVSFEPVAATYDNLEFNVTANSFKNVALHNVGLSDGSRSELAIYTSDDDLYDAVATLFRTDNRNNTIDTIRLTTLDAVLDQMGVKRLDVIKIDIEGAELSALQGSRTSLARFRPMILIEINKEMYEAAGYNVLTLTSFLASFGYEFYMVGSGGNLVKTPADRLEPWCNVLCKIKPVLQLRTPR